MNKFIQPHSKQYFAFNIWSIDVAKAIIDAASDMHVDVILQTSTKAFEALDKEELHMFVVNYAKKKNIHAYLHLDHCKRMDYIQEAAQYGWDSVMIDASDKPLEENILLTNQACAIVKERGILVEAEIGQVSGAEDELDVREAGIARIEDIESFLQRTNIDMLAPAIGTAHGLYQGVPRLDYGLIEKIAQISDVPLVIHGGTGLTNEVFRRLFSYSNVKKINISTNVKQAYRQGIENSIKKGYMKAEKFDPLKVTGMIHDSLRNMAVQTISEGGLSGHYSV